MLKKETLPPTSADKRPRSRIFVVGVDRGGAGKSTVAQLLEASLSEVRNSAPRIVEVDAEARLAALYAKGRVISKLITQSEIMDIIEDPTRAYALWEEIGLLLTAEGDVVLDLGGNLSVAFCDWARQVGVAYIGKGAEVCALVLCSGDPVSIESCQQTLGRMRAALPEARRWLIVNPIHAALSAESKIVTSIANAYDVAGIVSMKRCASPIFGAILDRKKPIGELDNINASEFVSASITPGTAHLGTKMYVDWVLQSTVALRPVFE